MNDDELDRRSAAEAARIRAEAAAIAETDRGLAMLLETVDTEGLPAGRGPSSDGIDITPAASRRQSTRWLVASAAVVLLAVAAGVVVFAARRDRGGSDQRLVPATSPPSAIAETPTTSAAPSATTVHGDSTTTAGWFVPTWVPDGFRIAGASATRMETLVGNGFQFDVWVDRSDPSAERRLQWTSFVDDQQMSSSTSVPGSEAVRGTSALVSEADGWIDIEWAEAGRRHHVAANLDRSTTLGIVEHATVTADGVNVGPGLLPEGLAWVDPALSDVPAAGGPTTSLTFQSDGEGPARLTFSVSPNSVGYSLDRDIIDAGSERRAIAGVERNVQTTLRDDGRTWTEVTWYDDGFAFYVQADDVDVATVDMFVAGITPADQHAFLAFEHEITDRGTASPVLDRATFADGLDVTLRSPDDQAFGGPDAWQREGYLCIDARPALCAAVGAGGSGSGDQWNVETSWLFDIDGHKTYLVWRSGPAGSLSVIGSNDPPTAPFLPAGPDGSIDEQLAAGGVPLAHEQAGGTRGTFVRIEVPDDVRYVTIHRDHESGGRLVEGDILDLPVVTASAPDEDARDAPTVTS